MSALKWRHESFQRILDVERGKTAVLNNSSLKSSKTACGKNKLVCAHMTTGKQNNNRINETTWE